MAKRLQLMFAGAFALGMLALGCANGGTPEPASTRVPDPIARPAPGAVRTGADVLAAEGFQRLRGLRVGLIANHTARVDTSHLSDLLAAAPGVELVALFGPEHGVRGTTEAGAEVRGGRDVRTGVPVHSLYGETNKPTPAMLRDVDVLLFDVQDVGSRFYTYISTMGLAMQAAAEQKVRFVVLDRPNPLGGDYVSGFVLEPEEKSFVGLFPIPIAHGLTVGELAHMVKEDSMVDGLEALDLEVVAMEGWTRDMRWPDTGLPWIAPSPNLPTFESALVYPGTCLFEALNASEGRGTMQPFLQVGAPYANAEELAASLNRLSLPGASFDAISFTPRPIEHMVSRPRFGGRSLEGVRITVADVERYQPVETGVHVIAAFGRQAAREGEDLIERRDWLARLAGTDTLGALLRAGADPSAIIEAWSEDVEAFRTARQPYLRYP